MFPHILLPLLFVLAKDNLVLPSASVAGKALSPASVTSESEGLLQWEHSHVKKSINTREQEDEIFLFVYKFLVFNSMYRVTLSMITTLLTR